MIKKRFISMLVLLAAVVTGAWAEEETLLTTITPTGDGTYSETTAGAVTVTPAGSFFYSGSYYGWQWDYYGSLTVTANEGYTIARCVFIQQGKNQSVTISKAPFALNFEEFLCLENYSMDGVTSIEVYGTAPAAPAGYAVSLKAETADEGNWTAKAGEGEYQSLPLEGVAANTAVSVKYGGTKKVKSVKAKKKAPATVPVTAITLNKTATTISAGQTETLSVSSVTPDNATDQTVTWSSDNDAVATVDADGKVTAVALGTANITATANDGSGVTATCVVTVSKVVTINQSDWGWSSSFTKDGVTVSAGMIDPDEGSLMDGGTFSTTLGNFTKIVVTSTLCNASGTGWSGSDSSMTWAGTPASTVSFSGDFMGRGGTTTIVCTIEPKN